MGGTSVQPGLTSNNSLCEIAVGNSPNNVSSNIEVPDSVSEDIAMEKGMAEEMETFLKVFPSIPVDKTPKTEEQKAAIKRQKMQQVSVLEEELPDLCQNDVLAGKAVLQ